MSRGSPARPAQSVRRRSTFGGLLGISLILAVLTACQREFPAPVRPGEIQPQAWPGSGAVEVVDASGIFNGNMSGLAYEPAGRLPGVLWAARNGPGSVFRLVWDGSIWTPDVRNQWGKGKVVRYPNGTGEPDAEGLTFVGGGTSVSVYLATERNNDVGNTSRNSILRFDAGAAGSTLVASHEWDLTGDIPATKANRGLEAIAFIPDTFLVASGFRDESTGAAFNAGRYPGHAGGLFFVGVEATGMIYAYDLDHTSGSFTRIASMASGLERVMGLDFDAEIGQIWAICDDGCDGRGAVLQIDTTAGSATEGRFVVTALHERPAGMPDVNNEGFALTPLAECVDGTRPVFWSDDAETGGHALRQGKLSCLSPCPVDPGPR